MRYLSSKDQVAILNGSPSLADGGTITATTTKNNSDTAVPFTMLANRAYLLQPDLAVYVKSGTTSGTTVTAANGLLIEAFEKYVITLLDTETFLAALSVSGASANLKVMLLR